MIYAHARLVYLDTNHFTETFPGRSLLVVSPTGPVVPRGHAKADTLARARTATWSPDRGLPLTSEPQ